MLAMLALAAAGCGESEKDRYIEDYRPLNQRLLEIGERIGRAPLEAGDESNAKLAQRFNRYGDELDRVNRDIEALDTPDDLVDESKALNRAVGTVIVDLENVATAAREADPRRAAAAASLLTDHANAINRAQNRLAKATGADIAPR
jgi:hypothetical protein